MKKNKIMLPLIGALCICSPSVGFLTSCEKPTEYVLQWNAKDGEFEYDKSIVPFTGTMNWHEATDAYIKAVDKNKAIFLNDVIQTIVNYDHGFAGNAGQGFDPDPVMQKVCPFDEGTWTYQPVYDIVSVRVGITKWDANTHRVSFNMNVELKSHDKNFPAKGHYSFKWENHPIALYSFAGSQCYDERRKHAPDSPTWCIAPQGAVEYWSQEGYTWEELVDPIYPGGTGASWFLMCVTDDWNMSLNEEYELPNDKKVTFNWEWDQNFWYEFRFDWADDPDQFSRWKYAWGHVCYIESITSMQQVPVPTENEVPYYEN